ncbi:hypothetical protein [Candidatus Palauibacter sp.]|uniref:hypothetical protein n=1 Tax=Candidatus Palauibacter sp. TaxID=3101350 RepID=UPI003C6F6693
MIHIVAGTAGDAERIRRAVGGDVQIGNGTNELPVDDGRVDCMIVGYRRGLLPNRVRLLEEMGRKLPLIPVILVTDRDTNVAGLLSGVRVSAIVWFDEVQAKLQSHVEKACHATALSQLADVFRQSTLPPSLRAALTHSIHTARSNPVRNLGELAHAVRCSPATLSQQFRRHATGATTLSRFLGGLVLLRAQQLRLAGSSWENVAGQLGFARATLNRKCRKWPGCTLRELEIVGPDILLASFVSQYVQPLLNGAGLRADTNPPRSDQPVSPYRRPS